jgi:Mg-chelatase subunit ChlD
VVHRSTIPSSLDKVEEKKGKTGSDLTNERLMHSVLENDKKKIEKGKLISEAINLGFSSFNPDMIFENLVKDYKTAKNIFGERIIRQLSGYNPSYVEKNIHIPEFRKELMKGISKNVEKLKEEEFLDKENSFTEKGIEMASLTLYFEELDNLIPKGILGEKLSKKSDRYGLKQDVRNFKKDRYKDIAIKNSVKRAIKRGHKNLHPEDLRTYERQAKGQSYIIYALDASGSMRGEKIEQCKKAGIALAFKAIDEKDKVGLITFGSDIKKEVMPTDNFMLLVREITKIRASQETNIAVTIQKAINMFPNEDITKHIILLTDALPTKGSEPQKETVEAVSSAKNHGITISLIGVNLDKKGKELAEKIVEIGKGRLYTIKALKNIDSIVLEDYYDTA